MKNMHKIDKSLIPTCDIMGVNIAAINMDWLLNFTQCNIKELAGDYMCVANVHTTVTAYEDETYKKIQNSGIITIPDGGPLASFGRKHGFHNMSRTTGPTYMDNIMSISEKNGYSHFFYGSTEETLEKMRNNLLSKFPKLNIAGMYSPPFRDLTQKEDENVINTINEKNPDFIWIGLGAPKQEIWMANHQGKVNGFMVGVGAAFDYSAGNIKRAPIWMQKCNLEWLYRLLQDPKRLFHRYFHTNIIFLKYVLSVK